MYCHHFLDRPYHGGDLEDDRYGMTQDMAVVKDSTCDRPRV